MPSIKRLFDCFFAILGLIFFLPIFVLVGLLIKLDSTGPVFFRQTRIGMHGHPFKIFKFRTMVDDADKVGSRLTTDNDPRITRVGKRLRRYKIDEIPQLINVLLGDMSFVGPRPEVERYMCHYPPGIREKILSIRPGITDKSSLEFRDENKLLSFAEDSEKFYIEQIMPIKQKYYLEYVDSNNIWQDIKIIMLTIKSAVLRM